MRGKSSSRARSMEATEKPSKSKEEPHLSGAYIRSLVKHLSSTRPKEQAMNPRSPNSTLEDHRLDEAQPLQSPTPPPPPPQQPKKQVRRRLHTSRPYQERLLNMAEARREIVTALKFHRAAMKQANEQQQLHQQQQQPPPPPAPPRLEDSRRSPNSDPNIYHSSQPPLLDPTFSSFTYPSLSWSYPLLAPLPEFPDNLNLPLPNQPLGLNLNFQGFDNIDTPLYNTYTNKDPHVLPLSPHSSSSSYSYSSPPIFGVEAMDAAHAAALGACDVTVGPRDTKLHLAMGEKEMAEIRSVGEKHEIEWNDTVNLVTSAWWSNFLETMEVDPVDGNKLHPFDEAVDVPAWLKDGSGTDGAANHLLMQHLDKQHRMQDASLPCLDIGETEWLDGDWLS